MKVSFSMCLVSCHSNTLAGGASDAPSRVSTREGVESPLLSCVIDHIDRREVRTGLSEWRNTEEVMPLLLSSRVHW